MNKLIIIVGVVVVSTTFFLFNQNLNLKRENSILINENSHIKEEMKQIRGAVKSVKDIKARNAIDNRDIIERLRYKGYLRNE